MGSDAILVALIKETMTAVARPRRTAARILIDVLGSRCDESELPQKLERIRADEEPAISSAMHALIDEYHLSHLERRNG